MDQQLDRLLARLKAQEADRRLDQIEPRVWARIAASRGRGAGMAAQLQWRAAAVGLALTFGAAFGGVAAAARPDKAPEMAIFSTHTALAPSTLIEGRP